MPQFSHNYEAIKLGSISVRNGLKCEADLRNIVEPMVGLLAFSGNLWQERLDNRVSPMFQLMELKLGKAFI